LQQLKAIQQELSSSEFSEEIQQLREKLPKEYEQGSR
jgi:hypothetical protein